MKNNSQAYKPTKNLWLYPDIPEMVDNLAAVQRESPEQLLKDIDTYFTWGYTMDENDSYLEELKKRIKKCVKS